MTPAPVTMPAAARAATATTAMIASVPSGPLVLPHVDYGALMPELILIGAAMLILTASAMTVRRAPQIVWTAVTVVASAAAGVASFVLWQRVTTHGPYAGLSGSLAVDGFSAVFLLLVSAATLLFALVANGWLEREGDKGPEMQALAMLSGSGAMLMASANDLIVLFLGLEIMSIALYVMAAMNHRREESGEAAQTYVLLGAFSSALLVYGIALTYGATGSTNLGRIAAFLSTEVVVSNGVLLAGMMLILVGLGFKVAAVPFHGWAPDVYDGSPSPVSGYMAAVAKAGGFAALVRVLLSSFSVLRLDWQPVVYGLALASLALGAILAVMQSDVKRMLAYSSISHVGFILVGVESGTRQAASGAEYYLFTYAFMVIGSFAVVSVLAGLGDRHHAISDFRGLAGRRPFLALSFTVLLLAQAGIPFTTGFLAKFYVLAAAVSGGFYVLATLAMLSAVVAAFFYLRLVLVMYGTGVQVAPLSREPAEEARRRSILQPILAGPGISVAGAASPVAVVPAGTGGGELPQGSAPEEGPLGGVFEQPPAASEAALPAMAAVAIGACVLVTVVFGIWAGPLVELAQRSTLLF